jgi:serine/threonine protein kinase
MSDESLPRLMTEAGPTLETAPPGGAFNDLKIIGPYHVLTLIGEGGMGLVYKAEQRQPIRRVVAIKIIKLGMDTKEVIARFESERQALAMLSHPNVAKVLDAGATETGRPYFVMEFVPGEPITTYCDRHQLTTRRRLELFVQACDAIQHAHSKAIIHRDIKPSNVLVTLVEGKPTVKVIDFGIAKATNQRLTERTVFTAFGRLIGTPEYMSPEQAEMGGLDVDTRTDIYSLGVVLYELLSGTLPFESKSLRSAAFGEIQRIIREVDPPRPSTRLSSLGNTGVELAKRRQTELGALARELRSELEWIPLKALRKDRTERYRTAAEMSEDIHNYLADRPLTAGPVSTFYQIKKFVRRNRLLVALWAALMFTLVAGTVTTLIMMIRAERNRKLAEENAAAAQREAQTSKAISDFQENMLSSIDPAKARGNRQITVQEVIDETARRIDRGAFLNQPLIESSVRRTIGKTYAALGALAPAEQQLRAALRLHDQSAPDDELGRADHLESLARVRSLRGDLSEAEQMMNQVLEIRRRRIGPESAEVGSTLGNLALIVEDQGDYPRAEKMTREAIAIQRKAIGHDDTQIATGLTNLATLLWRMSRFQEAEAIARESLALQRQLFGEVHPSVARATASLGMQLYSPQRLPEAEQLFRAALEIDLKLVGTSDHPDVASDYQNLGCVLRDESKLDEAEPALRKGLEMRRRLFGNDHPNVANSLNALAGAAFMRKDYSGAETLYREAVNVRRNQQPSHPETANLMANLGMVLLYEHKAADAEPVLSEAQAIVAATAAGPADAWRATWVRFLRGWCLAQQKRFGEAEPLMLDAYQELRDSPRLPDVRKEQMRSALRELYRDWSKPDQAAQFAPRTAPGTGPPTVPSPSTVPAATK